MYLPLPLSPSPLLQPPPQQKTQFSLNPKHSHVVLPLESMDQVEPWASDFQFNHFHQSQQSLFPVSNWEDKNTIATL